MPRIYHRSSPGARAAVSGPCRRQRGRERGRGWGAGCGRRTHQDGTRARPPRPAAHSEVCYGPPPRAATEEPHLTGVLLLYALTLFTGATLLFVMQPMVGKMILPLLGGTPAVWSTCLVFFLWHRLFGGDGSSGTRGV